MTVGFERDKTGKHHSGMILTSKLWYIYELFIKQMSMPGNTPHMQRDPGLLE